MSYISVGSLGRHFSKAPWLLIPACLQPFLERSCAQTLNPKPYSLRPEPYSHKPLDLLTWQLPDLETLESQTLCAPASWNCPKGVEEFWVQVLGLGV